MKSLILLSCVILSSLTASAQFYPGNLTFKSGEHIFGFFEFDKDEAVNYAETEDSEQFRAIPAEKVDKVEISVGEDYQKYVYYEAPFSIRFDNEMAIRLRLFRVISEGPKAMLLDYFPSKALVMTIGQSIFMLYVKKPEDPMPVMMSFAYTTSFNRVRENSYYDDLKYRRQFFSDFAVEYFADCPSLVSKIKSKELGERKSVDIVNYYNSNCQ